MRARRLSRLAGLVLALAVAIGAVTGWSGGGFSTMEFDWAGPLLEFDWAAHPHP
ncbi:hypothetical protein [Phytohabitans suffuscus]|uniref:hypothetical protein n=1 Tax=Phytohabitans suffuscus TaxID=624315 RepID=UPI001567A6EF|nr:hypothetical protein [Phytohabitans suffuscus]